MYPKSRDSIALVKRAKARDPRFRNLQEVWSFGDFSGLDPELEDGNLHVLRESHIADPEPDELPPVETLPFRYRPNRFDQQWLDLASTYTARYAKRLSQHACFAHEEVADLKQDLTLALMEAWDHYDPDQGEPGAFMEGVCKRKFQEISRVKQRELDIQNIHLDELDEEQAEHYLYPAQNDGTPRRQNLVMDVTAALEKMTSGRGALAEALASFDVDEVYRYVAKHLKISKGVFKRQIVKLRDELILCGLQAYTKHQPKPAGNKNTSRHQAGENLGKAISDCLTHLLADRDPDELLVDHLKNGRLPLIVKRFVLDHVHLGPDFHVVPYCDPLHKQRNRRDYAYSRMAIALCKNQKLTQALEEYTANLMAYLDENPPPLSDPIPAPQGQGLF